MPTINSTSSYKPEFKNGAEKLHDPDSYESTREFAIEFLKYNQKLEETDEVYKKVEHTFENFKTLEHLLDALSKNLPDSNITPIFHAACIAKDFSKLSILGLLLIKLINIYEVEKALLKNPESLSHFKNEYAHISKEKLKTQLTAVKTALLSFKTLLSYSKILDYLNIPFVNHVKYFIQLLLCLLTYQYLSYNLPALHNRFELLKPFKTLPRIEDIKNCFINKEGICTQLELLKKNDELLEQLEKGENLDVVEKLLQNNGLSLPPMIKDYEDWKKHLQNPSFLKAFLLALQENQFQGTQSYIYTQKLIKLSLAEEECDFNLRATIYASNNSLNDEETAKYKQKLKKESAVAQQIQNTLSSYLLAKLSSEIRSVETEQIENLFLCVVYAVQTFLPLLIGTALLETIVSFFFLEFTFIGSPILLTLLAVPSFVGCAVCMLLLFLKRRDRPSQYSISAIQLKIESNLEQIEYLADWYINMIPKLIVNVIAELMNRTGIRLFENTLLALSNQIKSNEESIEIRHKLHKNAYEKELTEYYLADLGITPKHLKILKESFLSLDLPHVSGKFDKFLYDHLNISTRNSENNWEYFDNKEIWDKIEKIIIHSDTWDVAEHCLQLNIMNKFNPFNMHQFGLSLEAPE